MNYISSLWKNTWVPNNMNEASDTAFTHCECSVCLTQTSAQTFSGFGNFSTACASFALSINRRTDMMSAFLYLSILYVSAKGKSYPIHVAKRWAQSWFQCTGSQPTSDFLSHPSATGCHYFPPRLRSPSQPKNVTVLWPVPIYTAWWTEAHRCEQLA